MRVVVKVEVHIRGTPAFAAPVKHDIRAFLQVDLNIVVNFLRGPGPGGVVIPLFAVDPDLRVVIVRRGHDGLHILGRSHDDNTVSINIIGGPAAVHIVTVRRFKFKDGPLAGATVLLIPLHFNVWGFLQTDGGREVDLCQLAVGSLFDEVLRCGGGESAVVFIVTIRTIPFGNPRLLPGMAFVQRSFSRVFQPIGLFYRAVFDVDLLRERKVRAASNQRENQRDCEQKETKFFHKGFSPCRLCASDACL